MIISNSSLLDVEHMNLCAAVKTSSSKWEMWPDVTAKVQNDNTSVLGGGY